MNDDLDRWLESSDRTPSARAVDLSRVLAVATAAEARHRRGFSVRWGLPFALAAGFVALGTGAAFAVPPLVLWATKPDAVVERTFVLEGPSDAIACTLSVQVQPDPSSDDGNMSTNVRRAREDLATFDGAQLDVSRSEMTAHVAHTSVHGAGVDTDERTVVSAILSSKLQAVLEESGYFQPGVSTETLVDCSAQGEGAQ